jgi:predicted RNase H-like HicB family nuclease
VANLKEVVELCLEGHKKNNLKLPEFVGVQEFEVSF